MQINGREWKRKLREEFFSFQKKLAVKYKLLILQINWTNTNQEIIHIKSMLYQQTAQEQHNVINSD